MYRDKGGRMDYIRIKDEGINLNIFYTISTKTTTVGLMSIGTRCRGIRCVRATWCVSIAIQTSITRGINLVNGIRRRQR